MDLGLTGKWALVCAASKGLGKGCASALAQPLPGPLLAAQTSAHFPLMPRSIA